MGFFIKLVGYLVVGLLHVIAFIWDLIAWPKRLYDFDFEHQSTTDFPKNYPAAATSSEKSDVKESKEEKKSNDQYVRRRTMGKEKILTQPCKEITTLYDNFHYGKKRSATGRYLGQRSSPTGPYEWLTYSQVETRVTNFGSGLIALGLKPGQSSHVGIYTRNCYHWVITEHATSFYSWVLVPLYDTLGKDATEFIVTQAELQCVVLEDSKIPNLLAVLASLRKDDKDDSKTVMRLAVAIGQASVADREAYAKLGVKLISATEVEKLGAQNPVKHLPPQPSDLGTICYTSGTTGTPKGVMLTHYNFIGMLGGMTSITSLFKVPAKECIISYLPLAHVIERAMEMWITFEGGSIGFFSGDVKRLTDDIKELKPTCMPVVPRVLERIYDKINEQVSKSGAISQMIFRHALAAKKRDIANGYLRRNSIWDFLVFRKIHKMLGGRLVFLLSGGAPLSAEIMQFMRAALGCTIVEAYGQTECAAGALCHVPGESSIGNVGPPTCSFEVKLEDVPELDCYAKDNKGEVCLRGPSVTSGYYKAPEMTKEVLDSEGWLHTGDVGLWLPNGCLKIIDRKKAIFKLSQGEYISPEKIEAVYARHPWVQQIVINGTGTESQLVAIVVVNPDPITQWAATQGIKGDISALCNNSTVVKTLLSELQALGKKSGLATFEQAFALKLITEVMTQENGFLTPTMKIKRNIVKKAYGDDIAAMYAELKKKRSS